jgi:hypothetical protein
VAPMSANYANPAERQKNISGLSGDNVPLTILDFRFATGQTKHKAVD